MTWGSYYWPVFLIISALWVILGFGIPELYALLTQAASHADNTLSHYAQSELGISAQVTRHTLAWWLSLAAWAVITTILTWHIWFRLGG